MCGLITIFDYSKDGLAEIDITMFQDLMYVNMLRGSDSTGIFSVKDGKVGWAKSMGNAVEFLNKYPTKEFIKKQVIGGRVLVGHCRSATKGTVSARNAHPFTVDGITMVKNGTITVKNRQDFWDWPVDSMWATKIIANEGSQEFVNMVEGGYAMIWYNHKDGNIHVLRNNLRPLYKANVISKDKTINQVWFASELAFLRFAACRYGLTISKEEYFEPYIEYTIDLHKDKFTMTSKKLKEPAPPPKPVEVVKIGSKIPVKYQNILYGGERIWVGKSITFTPYTWKIIGKSKKSKGKLTYMKFTGMLVGDTEFTAEVEGVVEIEEDMTNNIDSMTAKVSSITADGSTILFNVHQPFFNMKEDIKHV